MEDDKKIVHGEPAKVVGDLQFRTVGFSIILLMVFQLFYLCIYISKIGKLGSIIFRIFTLELSKSLREKSNKNVYTLFDEPFLLNAMQVYFL